VKHHRRSKKLTARQTQFLTLLSEGKLHKEIAEAMAISPHGVRHWVDRMKKKFSASNPTQLVVFFVLRGGR
jgi:DNA-binding NarL/FixJ family response regulator